jgi:hypothetical protein
MNESNDKAEAAFEAWKARHHEYLMAEYPATQGHNGAANNFSYWCRQVYTGRIKLDRILE